MCVLLQCNVPPNESREYHTWVARAAPLLASPADTLTLVRGSELDQGDLLFAGAHSARAVLIFAPVVEADSGDASAIDTAKQTADCMTVLTAMRVRHVSPSSFTCCEIHEGSNAR